MRLLDIELIQGTQTLHLRAANGEIGCGVYLTLAEAEELQRLLSKEAAKLRALIARQGDIAR